MNLVSASDEENIRVSVFTAQSEEKKAVNQREQFSIFNRLMNAEVYVKRALGTHKAATLELTVEQGEKAKATMFKLPRQEQYGEGMKSLNAENVIPKSSKIFHFSLLLNEGELIMAKLRIGKSQWHFNI